MFRRMILPLLFGLLGAAFLTGLGVWQMQRLAWKEAIIADIDARIQAAPVALPETPDPERDRYLPVRVTGRFLGPEVEVLASRKEIGAGTRIIAAYETTEGRRIMVDRGFVPDAQRGLPRDAPGDRITGNLHWPDEVDSFTPAPDAATGLWFARDVAGLAAQLETEPTLIVAARPTGDGIDPLPVDSSAIPNDHLTYAVTWFSLALVWLGMTGLLLWRIRRRSM